jgi:nitrogen fixation NifU-like protein
MNRSLNTLYPAVIRLHSDQPYHFEKIETSPITLLAYNPVCGDKFEIYLRNDHPPFLYVSFHGYGCAISKASTSLLVQSLEGKSAGEALDQCQRFIRFLRGDPTTDGLSGDLLGFAGVHEYPERFDCAALPWIELEKFLINLHEHED